MEKYEKETGSGLMWGTATVCGGNEESNVTSIRDSNLTPPK